MFCGKCCAEKTRDEFPVSTQRRNGRQKWCKGCQTKYRVKWLSEHPGYTQSRTRRLRTYAEQMIQHYLEEHPCVDCGEGDPVVLEFDHVRGAKVTNVSDLRRRRPWDIRGILAEIAKCDVRCANCHRRKTHRERLTTTDTHDTDKQCLLPLTFEPSTRNLFEEPRSGRPKRE